MKLVFFWLAVGVESARHRRSLFIVLFPPSSHQDDLKSHGERPSKRVCPPTHSGYHHISLRRLIDWSWLATARKVEFRANSITEEAWLVEIISKFRWIEMRGCTNLTTSFSSCFPKTDRFRRSITPLWLKYARQQW